MSTAISCIPDVCHLDPLLLCGKNNPHNIPRLYKISHGLQWRDYHQCQNGKMSHLLPLRAYISHIFWILEFHILCDDGERKWGVIDFFLQYYGVCHMQISPNKNLRQLCMHESKSDSKIFHISWWFENNWTYHFAIYVSSKIQ